MSLRPWVIGSVIVLFSLSFITQAQGVSRTLLGSRAFSGGAQTAAGYNTALWTSLSAPSSPSGATLYGLTEDFINLATISGVVWWDRDGSTTMSGADYGIPGSIIDLYLPGDLNTPAASVLTDSAGHYKISVAPGTYYLRNTTPSSQGNYLKYFSSDRVHIDPTDPTRYVLNLTAGDQIPNLNFSETTFPEQLISKRLFLSSSDPLRPVPEPGVWWGLLSAGLVGLASRFYKRKRAPAR